MTDQDERRRLLLAYTLTQMASIQEAMWRLADLGDNDARPQAMFLQSWLNAAANEWAGERDRYVSHPDDVPHLIRDAREYLTGHRVELDSLLAQVNGGIDDSSRH